MKIPAKILIVKTVRAVLLSALFLRALTQSASAQSDNKIVVPDWALPGSATHRQVPPPKDFHRPARTAMTPIGIFKGQSDVGGALVACSSSYNPATKQYTINSAGYNIWYTRDEFRYLWKKMSGDVSLAADVSFPDSNGYSDRKAIVIIRQSLDDDSKEAMVALHGGGLMHLAWRPEKGTEIKEMKVDIHALMNLPANDKTIIHAKRIGIEKKGDQFTLYVSMTGEPMHPYGQPTTLHLDGPFYVGIGFCSHQPAEIGTGVLSNVVLVNSAGKVR
jgi:hypothetical protein